MTSVQCAAQRFHPFYFHAMHFFQYQLLKFSFFLVKGGGSEEISGLKSVVPNSSLDKEFFSFNLGSLCDDEA